MTAALLVLSVALAFSTPGAAAADLGVAAPSLATAPGLPACDDPAVLRRIVRRQHGAEERTWRDGVRIEGIRQIRQTDPRTRFTSAVEHRHCRATADLGPRRSDTLYYMISRGLGFASIGWEVDFCMPRHDRWRVYDAQCRVLR